MLRQLHSLPGLFAALFVILLAVTGAVMSVQPVLDRLGARDAGEMSVADLAGKIQKLHPSAELITRSANGTIVVQYFTDIGLATEIIDPKTGQTIAAKEASAIFGFFKQLHRTFYIGTTGRIVAGITAFIMLLACISGLFMLAKRLGGWRKLFTKSKGKTSSNLHVDISRIIIVALFITALTGTYMSLAKFEFIDDGKGVFLPFPDDIIGTEPTSVANLTALKSTPISNFRELRFPFEDDFFDMFTLTTSDGQGYIDQVSGEFLVFQPNSTARTIYEFFYMLHTGQGLWWLGALLGIAALGLPILAITGTLIWWRRRSTSTNAAGNIAANKAETIILVGSETNASWGFAHHLHQQLNDLGVKSHIAEMNKFAPQTYSNAKNIIFLAATYGDGSAPETASKFMQKLNQYNDIPTYKYAVLGFGDKQFSQFGKFAIDVDNALSTKGWQNLLPLELVDKQSSQTFENWGFKLGEKLNLDLKLNHVVALPKTHKLTVTHIDDYEFDGKFSTRILQFSLPENMPNFEAGDLVGILAPDSDIPRYYSLATSAKDGALGICVAKKHGGICSPFLHSLKQGDQIEAYIQINSNFRPEAKKPIIMIGAGTGIAPFIGFINNTKTNAHLYWGGRHPDADFLYKTELDEHLKTGKLTQLTTAFSRTEASAYVQHKLAQDADHISNLMQQGAQFIVCGGSDMATEVKQTLTEMGYDIEALKQQKRYVEDVY